MSQKNFVVYGAYGYTGRLIVDEAVRRGLNPVLAGRNAERLKAVADATGLECRSVDLNDSGRLDSALADASLVIHAAGPFAVTSAPMASACIRTGTHYLDVTGEVGVFEALAGRQEEAKDAGVMLMPGVGFDVVPSDCLAAHLHRRLPDGNRLSLAIAMKGGISRGTARTMALHMGYGGTERVDGELVGVPVGQHTRMADFGRGNVPVISIPWGDLATAWRSTGVPNIRCYARYPAVMRIGARASRWIAPLLRSSIAQTAMSQAVNWMAPGPDETARQHGHSLIWGELTNEAGRRVSARVVAREGYWLTAMASVDIAMRVMEGAVHPGFVTPSQLLGADYILELDGSERVDIE